MEAKVNSNAEIYKMFENELKYEKKSEGTIKIYLDAVQEFINWYESKYRISVSREKKFYERLDMINKYTFIEYVNHLTDINNCTNI